MRYEVSCIRWAFEIANVQLCTFNKPFQMSQSKAPRSDAQANRLLLLDAALQVFTEHGVAVALDAIAERAGVSRATLYRNFADRDVLLNEVLLHALDRLEDKIEESAHGDTGGAFYAFLRMWGQDAVQIAPLTDYWRALPANSPLVLLLRERLSAIVKPLIRQAVAAGECRDDLGADDLILLVGIFSAARRGRTERERLQLVERAWELVVTGLRPRDSGEDQGVAP